MNIISLGLDLSSKLDFSGVPIWVIIVYLLAMVLFGILAYVLNSFVIYRVSLKLKSKENWQAWVPVLRFMYFFELGDQNKWLYLLSLVPCVGIIALVFGLIATVKVLEKLGKPKWHVILFFIPIVNIVYMIMLAL